jgi:hypothetical protein
LVAKIYLQLRNQILVELAGKLTVPPPGTPEQPVAVVMDWNTGRGVASIVAVADSTASIYTSTGGGKIGGGQGNEEIRMAALQAVAVANELRSQMSITQTFPLPEPGEITFYAMSNNGVYVGTGNAKELAGQVHPLSKLGNAMQNIVTLYHKHYPGK